MKYAKLENGLLCPAPNPIRVGDIWYGNPPAQTLRARGYKPVRYTAAPEPEAGFTAVPGWEEQEEALVQTWTLEPEDELTEAELLSILLGGA